MIMRFLRPTDKRAELEEALRWLVSSETLSVSLLTTLIDRLRPRTLDNVDQARANLRVLVDLLHSRDSYKNALRRHVMAMLSTRNQTRFFSDGGILPATGFFTELRNNLIRRLLPEVVDDNNLQDVIKQIFRHPKDHLWLDELAATDLTPLLQTLQLGTPGGNADLRHSEQEMLDAVLLLSHRISALGMEAELLRLCPRIEDYDSPFFAQATETGLLVKRVLQHGWTEQTVGDSRHIRVLLQQCSDILRQARSVSHATGTSLSLTYLLARLEQQLNRLDELLAVLGERMADAAQQEQSWYSCIGRIAVADNQRRSLSLLVANITRLLALRVTENAGKTGEHYITDDRRGYIAMWRSAAGAGVLIGLLALIKIGIGKLALAPLNMAFLLSLNYGLGFVLVYLLHFTIATKQPAMTAATLAGAISQTRGRIGDPEPLARMVVDVLRSQLAAIGGNVLVAVATAVGIASLYALASDGPIISADKSQHLLHDLSPVDSPALFHAAIAGVYLFLAGLLTGYFDNLASHAQLSARIQQLRWLRFIAGSNGAKRIGDFFGNNLGGLGGNFLFGCMLGSTATLGFLFGLPLDIRHIAFASANFGYAVAAMQFHLPPEWWIKGIAGIALIGLVNLVVSFWLALWLAMRSRGIPLTRARALVPAVVRLIAQRPGALFFPPPDKR